MSTARAVTIALLLASCGGGTLLTEEPRDRDEVEPTLTYAVALRLEDAGEDENATPRTRVALVKIEPDGAREIAELRVELGACWHEPVPNAMIAARCWWGGAGARYEVRREGELIVAWRAGLDEETGEAIFEEAGRIEVPSGATLRVLTPESAAPVHRGSVSVMPVER